MSLPKPPKPAKLIIGMFTRDRELIKPVTGLMADQFGPIDLVSPLFSFDYTHYYEPEMGPDLIRRMVVFKQLIDQDALARIKLATNRIESQFLNDDQRRVNIDPGYLLGERFVLATGKNFTHRIYIGHQIYADLTLIYQRGKFTALPWTYPDYMDERMQSFLRLARAKYLNDIKIMDN